MKINEKPIHCETSQSAMVGLEKKLLFPPLLHISSKMHRASYHLLETEQQSKHTWKERNQ